MKIRVSGEAEIIKQWVAQLEREYGLYVKVSPSRRGSDELRAYINIPDIKRPHANLVALLLGGSQDATRPPAAGGERAEADHRE